MANDRPVLSSVLNCSLCFGRTVAFVAFVRPITVRLLLRRILSIRISSACRWPGLATAGAALKKTRTRLGSVIGLHG